jgi:hypothetical protein
MTAPVQYDFNANNFLNKGQKSFRKLLTMAKRLRIKKKNDLLMGMNSKG